MVVESVVVYFLICLFSGCSSFSLPQPPPQSLINNLKRGLQEVGDSWDEIKNQNYPTSMDEARKVHKTTAGNANDPYNIVIKEEVNWTRISFDSLLYKDQSFLRSRYILFNKLPSPKCDGMQNLPYAVFLPGFGAVPEDYGVGFPFITELISNDTICCFYTFMPYFFILPVGGYWYTNNDATIPEYYLFIEILAVINHAMGNLVSKDPQMRVLAGHSMGGYGAVMNAMRTNMQFFGSVCALNGGLYIWNLPEFQNDIAEKVLNEAITRKAGPFQNCSYEQPPYRYYADDVNFNTIVSSSLAAVFHSDGTTTPKSNSPYFSATLFNPDCERYGRFFGFKYWLDENGVLDQSLFSIAPYNSPLGFLQLNYPALRVEMSGNLFLSTTYNDTVVNYLENVKFSEELDRYNISHVFKIYQGSHYDVFEGIAGCFQTFAPKVCSSVVPVSPSNGDNPVPLWGFVLAVSAAGVFLVVIGVMTFFNCKKSSYDSIE